MRDWSKFKRFWDKPKVDKFDPKTLQPFDKILVRNSKNDDWTIEYYHKRNKDKSIQELVYSWNYVIPYNEETKNLVSKTKDCPEYYKWWKE